MNSNKNLVKPIVETPVSTSTSRENMEVTEDQCITTCWSDLPALAVENIYSFLERKDQKSMSLVCRNWREEYSSPSLWRRVRFCFPEPEKKTELYSSAMFAWRYGFMIHHAEIILRGAWPTFTNLTNFGPVILFMEGLARNSQLLSISLEYFFLTRVQHEDGTIFGSVYEAILKLLNSQKRLESIRLAYSEFSRAEAEKVLRVIFVNNSTTLKYLCLQGLVLAWPRDELKAVDDDLNCVVLMNLVVLEIDYTQLFLNIMLSFYECRRKAGMAGRKGNLKEIKLCVNVYRDVYYYRMDTLVWEYFRKIFPSLRIDVNLTCPSDLSSISTFIVPRMPVRALNFNWIYGNVQEIGSLLRHMTSCDVHETIEELSIEWGKSSSNLSPDLIKFTNDSPKLRILELVVEHPVAALDTVFKGWVENRPNSLRFVEIYVSGVLTSEENSIYTDLSDTYVPLLQSLDLKLSLQVLKHF